ncbi:hypothetical protein D3C80_1901160 [compost metagenome]
MTHQGDRRSFDGDITAAAHGDPDIGLSQSRGVIDAVTDHRYPVALSLQLLDRFGLTVG